MQRMRELSVMAVNDTYSTVQKIAMSTEFVALASQINQIAANTQYNGMDLLSGSGGVYGGTGSFLFQIGGNTTQTIAVSDSPRKSAYSTLQNKIYICHFSFLKLQQ
jgi:flagellin